jgi:hypothetical protein
MATYYVRTDGNNSNVGTGSTSGQAWQTVTYALANMVLTTGTNYLYIAPGVYRETPTVTVTPSSTQTLVIQGDTTASLFSGISAGPVRITNFINDNTYPTSGIVFACAKTYVTIRNVYFAMYGSANFTNAQYITIDKCTFESTRWLNETTVKIVANGTTPINGTISNSIFIGSYALNICGPSGGASFNFAVSISNCLFFGQRTILTDSSVSQFTSTGGNGLTVYNSTFMCDQGIGLFTTNTTNLTDIKNCNFIGTGGSGTYGIVGSATYYTEDFNRFSTTIGKIAGALSTNSKSGTTGIDWSSSLITAGISLPILAPTESSPLTGTGTSTGAPATDIYGNAWVSGTDIGAFARQTIAGAGFYVPTERNASTITIAPGSTSQSIELYLGATGLTASTAGLSAYYNRTRSADVQITPLVARTIGQPWTSGGFAEVNPSTMPGVYRLDLPDAAVAAGADDVTVVVRGASGTNGAVMTIKLSSGGLTAAQTAQAVLDAVASTHNNIGSIGAFIQDKSGYSLSTSQTFNTTGSVGSVTGNVSGNVTGTVGGVVGNVVGNLTGSVATVASPDNIIDGVWDEQRIGHTASGSFGEKLQTNALADEMLARDLGSGLNAGTAEERTVRSALRALRNKVNVGSSQMVVKKEDDTTDAWTASVTTTAVSSNVSGIDPN